MAKPLLLPAEALPPGSTSIMGRLYISPAGELYLEPQMGYPVLVLRMADQATPNTYTGPVYRRVISAYPATIEDHYLDCSGTFTLTLPSLGLIPQGANTKDFEVMNTGTGTITVVGQGGELINGNASIVIAAGTAFKFIWTGSAYRVKY